MATTAPPAAETKKPATPPPSKDEKATGGRAGAGKGEPAADKQARAPAGDKAAANPGTKSAAAPTADSDKTAATSQQRFDRMAVRAKLAVSEPGDAIEREADQVAERISRKADMRGGTPGATVPAADANKKKPPKAPAPAKATPATEPQPIARHAAPDQTRNDDGPVTQDNDSTHADASSSAQDGETQTRIRQRLGHGEPMDDDVRVRMEREFGHDLSHVRIHQDTSANEFCRSMGALAFTSGSDVFFAAGRFQPGSKAGIALLAHELTHVVQQQDSQPAIARKIDPDMPAKYKEKDAMTSKAALAELGKLEIPSVKARHLPLYTSLLGGNLKRKRGYDRGSPNQVDVWNKQEIADAKIRSRLKARGLTNIPDDAGESFKFMLGTDTKAKSWSVNQLKKKLKIPIWSRYGKPLGKGFQVDHIVELQVSGEHGTGTGNALQNMELLDQPSNSSSGGAIRSRIYQKVDAYLKTFKPAPKRRAFLKAHDIVFESVQANLKQETGAMQADSSWWTYAEIQDAVPLDQVSPAPPSNEEGTATEFLLASSANGVVMQRVAHKTGAGTFAITGTAQSAISGLLIDSITIDDKAASGTGSVGSVSGTWNLPKKWSAGDTKVSITLTGDGKHRGYPSKLGKTKLHFAELSPVDLDDIAIEDGKVSAEGNLTPSLPLLKAPIKVTLLGDDIRFSLDYSAGQLDLPAPLSVDEASISVFYSTAEGFGVSGDLLFSLDKVGGGELKASFTEGKGVSVEGQFDFESELFDVAQVKAWWRKPEGFGASGELAITQAGKIKGLKSAHLKAKYENAVFTASGTAETDIPGIKGFKADVKFVDAENFTVTGVGELEKLPGIEGGSLTMTVERLDRDWSLSGKGQVTPKLPGGAKGSIDGTYKDGVVLLRGSVHFSYGDKLLDGDVTVAVTNAASVDKDGNASGEGGKRFKVFGEGELNAALIKDKLDGKLKLRLLPDGSIRVGGGLKTKDFEVFGKYPKDGGEFFNNTFSTPPVPLPGLGFAVGSVSVGITFSASITAKAHANVGPGKLSGITLTVTEFDPANANLNALEFTGGGTFEVFADAGFGADARINLIFGAAIAELVGSVGAEATAGIPPDKPILSLHSDFIYSQAKGLDLNGNFNLNIQPALKFRLFGEVSARLNIVVDTITVWKKDWTLAEANYKLPVGIQASGSLGYNSKTGKIRPENPADAIKVERPKLDADTMKGVVMGDSAPPTVKTTDKQGKELNNEELMCTVAPSPALAPNQSMMSNEPNQSVMPRHENGAAPPPARVDENIVGRLGSGMPLDLATRGYFEQRMKVDLTQVRIHTGPAAAREAEKLAARAFTVGNHIAFAQNEYDPHTAEGQELIAHELAHIAQMQGGGQPIVLRWPAVTRTDAHTAETPASIRAMSLSDFSTLTQTQLDWATSPALQADAAALGQFRDLQTFADGANILDACGGLNMGNIIAEGIPAVYPALRKYTAGVSGGTAWLRWTDDTTKAERWGSELTTLEAAWPAANLSLVMRAPDPVSTPSPFERLEDPATPELPNFISYLTTCRPILSADNGMEVDSFLRLRTEGAMPTSYTATITHVTNYHHFTKNTLDGLARNEAVPQWQQNFWLTQKPMTAVLYPSVDHNGAFHRNAGLDSMVNNSDILTIVIEGQATVADYTSQLAPVAARYGENGEIQQAMIGGHGNSTIMVLAGGMAGAGIADERLGTTGGDATHTTDLMAELTRLMSSDPTKRRIVLDACLTNSHHVRSPLRAAPADAAADVNAAIGADRSLRDFVAGVAGAGANVSGSNSSFVPAQTTFLTPGTTDIGLSVPGDPDLIADKLTYVEFGTEPEGCMRALLEQWAADQIAGTHNCRDAVLRRIGAGQSAHVPAADTWRESIIQPLYDLAVNHYWGNGDALRLMGTLAGSIFELYWAGHTSASSLDASLAVLSNPAHIDQLLTRVSAKPHYAATPRVALVIEQAWMQHNPARHAHFLTALGRYASCQEAAADMDMGMVMPHVPLLLTLPPAVPPPAEQLRLALLAAHHAPVGMPPPSPLPVHADFLNQLLGAGPDFPAALGITAALGGLPGGESGILTAIGKPLAGGPPPPRGGPAPNANINLGRSDVPDRNDFAVTPLRRNGVVATVRDDLMVRNRPTTSTNANILARLPTGTPVRVIGEFRDWYVIEQPGSTGFVAKRYITLVP